MDIDPGLLKTGWEFIKKIFSWKKKWEFIKKKWNDILAFIEPFFPWIAKLKAQVRLIDAKNKAEVRLIEAESKAQVRLIEAESKVKETYILSQLNVHMTEGKVINDGEKMQEHCNIDKEVPANEPDPRSPNQLLMLTQAEYDALSPQPRTLYFITDA